MLVFSRKLEESFLIDGPARVTVLRIAGGQVRLGIEAPDDTRIMRSELPPAAAMRGLIENPELAEVA